MKVRMERVVADIVKAVLLLGVVAFMITTVKPLELSAQATTTVRGKVIDSSSGEPMIGVNVIHRGNQLVTITDINGQYSLNGVPLGQQTIEFAMPGYQRSQANINVVQGAPNYLNISLSYQTIGELVVTAKRVSNTEAAILSKRKKAAVAQDAISAEQISKSPDSDAADAAKRVTGVTIVGGDTVFIRGLGERYSSVQFAGSTIPSPNPDKRIVPLDVFPTGLIDSMEVTKAYTPDQPGEFAGGIVNINPKEYPSERIIKVTLGTSINTNTLPNDDFYTYEGGGMDFLGYDDGTRALPDVLDGKDFGDLSDNEKEELGESLKNEYSPNKETPMMPGSFSLTVGDSYKVGQSSTFGFIASGFFKESSKNKEIEVYRHGVTGPLKDVTQKRSTYTAKTGGLLSLGYTSSSQKFRITSVYSHTGQDMAQIEKGTKEGESEGGYWKVNKLQFREQTLFFNQIGGENLIFGGIKGVWNASYSLASMYEPDTRTIKYEANDEGVYTQGSYTTRFYLEHEDVVYEVAPALVFPFKQWNGLDSSLKVGGAYTARTRESDSLSLSWANSARVYTNIENELNKENIGDTYNIADVTYDGADYEGEMRIIAGYGMLDIPLWHKVRLVGGARYENSDLDLKYYDSTQVSMVSLDKEPLERHNVLPAASLTYSVTDDVNIRLASSKTIARPDFREVSPFPYETFVSNEFILGNTELEQTEIYNYDFRTEWYPSASEVLAFSVFYKNMQKPIELMEYQAGGDAIYYQYINAKSADNYGAELEVRKSFNFVSKSLEDLYFRTNLAYIDSNIKIKDTDAVDFTNNERPLQGQSPYVINVGLDYELKNLGSNFTLLYNIYGRRIVAVGASEYFADELDPDFSESNLEKYPQGYVKGEGGYNIERGDIYEEPVGKLDFVFKQNFGNLSLKFTASNLLDPEIKQTQKVDVLKDAEEGEEYAYEKKTKTYTTKKYKDGRTFGLSMSMSF